MSQQEDGNVWMPIIVIWGSFFAIGAMLFSYHPSPKSPEMCMIPANPLPETYNLIYTSGEVGLEPRTPAIALAATPDDDGGSYIDLIDNEHEMLFFTPTHWPWSVVYVQTSINKEDSGFSAIWTYEAPHVLYVRADIFVLRLLTLPSMSTESDEEGYPLPTEACVCWPEEIAIYDTYYEEWLAEQEGYMKAYLAEIASAHKTQAQSFREGIQDGGTRHKMTLGS